MASNLKTQNAPALVTALVANLAIYAAAMRGGSIALDAWRDVVADLATLVPAAAGVLVAGLINSQISGETKARLVFLRWSDPLPGSEAFGRYLREDSRVDAVALREKYGPLPTEPRDQNTLWYRWYRAFANDPAVAHAHREYLFYRDYTTLALMVGLVLGPAAFIQASSSRLALAYAALLVVQLVLVGRAARMHGRRMVCTVLAIKAAEG